MWFIGLIIGMLVGSTFGSFGALLGGGLGAWLGWMFANRNETAQMIPLSQGDETVQRIYALEGNVRQLNLRIQQLEKVLNATAPVSQAEPVASQAETAVSQSQPVVSQAEPVASEPPPDVATDTLLPQEEPAPIFTPQLLAWLSDQPESQAATKPLAAEAIPARADAQTVIAPTAAPAAQAATTPNTQQRPAVEFPPQDTPSDEPEPFVLPSFLTKLFSGNILAKIGVVLLFFGVASALKLAVQHGMFPIQVRLLLGAVSGVAMVMFGWSRAQIPKHQMFGFALQGGGYAILYLLVYFMLARYQMISPTLAFIAYTLLGVSCTLFAAKQDSLSLAVLGISGAFLSPVLASSGSGDHVTLFSYFALLNVFVFALNWFKSWRQLNIVGFLFTLVIGMNWALHAYQPEHLNSTEFFLVLFFLMYSLEPIFYALFRQATIMEWGDGLLLFGVPAIAVASQSVLMQPYEYGLAWSVFLAGLYYLALWWVLYRRQDETLKLAERSHLGIAVALLTYAVPLTFGAKVTAATWTVEGCAVLWLGIRQDRYLARWTGIALQILAGGYFLTHFDELSHVHAVFNDVYLGSFITAMAGFASGLMLHRWEKKPDQVSANSLFYWGLLWLGVATCAEIQQFVAVDYQDASWLSFFAALVLALEIGGKHWNWAALRQMIWLLFYALVIIAFHAITSNQHILSGALTLIYPATVALCYWLIARQERDELDAGLPLLRAGLFWGLSLLVSNETAWTIQHYLFPFPYSELWYWLPFGITFSAIALWRGIRRDEPLARVVGIAVQLLSGLYLIAQHDDVVRQVAIFNDFYLGSVLVSVLGLATAWLLHRKDATSASANSLFYWGLAWLLAPACLEIQTFTPSDYQDAAWLGLIAAVVGLLELDGKRENWAALRQMIWLLFIAIGSIAVDAILREQHVLYGMLILVFPAAVALYYWQLARQERDEFNVGLPALHLWMFWGLGALTAHEIAWGAQQLTPNTDLWHWLAYGGSFAAITLATLSAQRRQLYPVANQYGDYAITGLLPVVFASIGWFALACVQYSGDGSGLPYIPVLNPLDLVMLLSLYSIHRWVKAPQPSELKPMIAYALPAGAFLMISTLAGRLAHHWGGVAFDWDVLLHNAMMHALLSVIWTLTSITLMIYASRLSSRRIWFIGFGLLAVVGAKLMLVDLRNTGTITWTASLIGIALLVIAASYFSPAPPKKETEGDASV
ncbi:MAG: DUF2339 domain-containing protein [Gallionella sp.]|nr:DUF2339 domain-containing protein [Gallionella sp.]MDD4960056.1 DUF2339 domain-containing protein [Gallionella sp.]